MITIEMPPASRQYSIAVAADSSFTKAKTLHIRMPSKYASETRFILITRQALAAVE